MLIVAAHVLCAFLFLAPGYVRPDSIAIFAWLRSAVFDGDFAFFNEWASAGLVRNGLTLFSEVTPTGALANHWWIGTSILSAPPYLIAHILGGPADGFGGLYAVVLAWTNVAFAIAAMLIAWKFMPDDVSPRVAAVALMATSIGTPLFWQTFRFPLGTHAAGALAIGLVFLALFGEQRDSGLAAGLATGLAIAVRIQHCVIVPAVILVAIRERRPLRWWIAATAGGAIPVACQLIAWWSIYGTPLGPIARGGNLAGTTWMPFHTIALWSVLVSSYHGLFSWSPVVILSIAGWIFSARSIDRRRQTMAMASLLMFAGEWVANGTFDRYFWGGMSFGPRRFVDLAVPLAIGIAWCASATSGRMVTILASLGTFWSAALMVAAHAGTIPLARYVSATDLVRAVFSADTWMRAVQTPLHSPIEDAALAKQSLIAIVILVVVGFVVSRASVMVATIAMLIVLLFVIVISIRTPQRAIESARRLHIDTVASARFGPLLDQRGLLTDELAYERAAGDLEAAARTERELRAINSLLQSLSARPSR
jgi:hypothetical protein